MREHTSRRRSIELSNCDPSVHAKNRNPYACPNAVKPLFGQISPVGKNCYSDFKAAQSLCRPLVSIGINTIPTKAANINDPDR